MIRITFRMAAALALALLLAGASSCDWLDDLSRADQEIVLAQSDKLHDAAPQVTQNEMDALVAGNSAFALDLYQALRIQDENLFYSPFSISIALAMTYAGAREETELQMGQVLRFSLPQDRLHPAFNALGLELASRGEGAVAERGRRFQLKLANAIWGQRDYAFLPEFLDLLAIHYGAGLRLLDFASDPEASRLTINEWVSRQTEGKIQDLLPPSSITPATTLVLTNAVYFNAAWHYPFEEKNTAQGAFHLLDQSQVSVPMMHQRESFAYAQGDGYQAVELPYRGKDEATVELSMVILLPQAGRFEEVAGSLDAQKVQAILADLQPQAVELALPKFSFEASFNLNDPLGALGMPIAFTGSANFSGMDGTRDLFISDVVHKAFVAVDEAGTEAAAATAVIIGRTSVETPVEVMVDRPFVFLIRDIPTGAILFMGQVVNPAV